MSDATALPHPLPGALRRSLKDERLAARAAGGDERAFAAIYRRHHQDLYRYCQAILGNPQDANDALQNTMLRVLSALPGEQREIKLRPWLYRIAHNESISLLRRRRPTAEIDPEAATAEGDPHASLEARMRLRQLTADLAQLPDRQRAALLMRELSGLSCDEIAAALSTSSGVARQTIYEARTALQQMAEGREMSCDAVKRAISDGDGRTLRRRDLRAHLGACESCADFGAGIRQRQDAFGALCPLTAAASVGVLHAALGSSQGGSAGGLLAGILGGTGQAAAVSTAVKSAVAVVAVAGAGVAANDAGVIDAGLPGSAPQKTDATATPEASPAAGIHDPAVNSPSGELLGGSDRPASPSQTGETRGGRRSQGPAASTPEAVPQASPPGRPDAAPSTGPNASPANGHAPPAYSGASELPAPAAADRSQPSRAPPAGAAPVQQPTPPQPAPGSAGQPDELPLPVVPDARLEPPTRAPAG